MELLYLAVAPSIAILLFVYAKDKYDKEPMKYLMLLFFLGCLTVIPAVILEVIAGQTGMRDNKGIIGMLADAFFGIALIEEGVKYAVLIIMTWKYSKYFNQMYDGIVYAVFISLGFATVENILYVVQGGYTTGILRALTAVPCHAIAAVAMGYYIGIGKFRTDKKERRKYLMLGLFVPVMIHGVYDFLVLSENLILILLCIPFLIFLYVYAFRKIKKLVSYNHYIMDTSKDDDFTQST